MKIAEDVYYALLGELDESIRISWVKNAYAEGSICSRAYEQMLTAYERLCDRLGVEAEDEDVEKIVNALLVIQKELCLNMFHYGVQYGKNMPHP